jgi:hypothetical protein
MSHSKTMQRTFKKCCFNFKCIFVSPEIGPLIKPLNVQVHNKEIIFCSIWSIYSTYFAELTFLENFT